MVWVGRLAPTQGVVIIVELGIDQSHDRAGQVLRFRETIPTFIFEVHLVSTFCLMVPKQAKMALPTHALSADI